MCKCYAIAIPRLVVMSNDFRDRRQIRILRKEVGALLSMRFHDRPLTGRERAGRTNEFIRDADHSDIVRAGREHDEIELWSSFL